MERQGEKGRAYMRESGEKDDLLPSEEKRQSAVLWGISLSLKWESEWVVNAALLLSITPDQADGGV